MKQSYVISACILSSVLFAIMHEPQPTQGLARWGLMLLFYAGVGAVFAGIYQKTGRPWSAILAHASNNLLAIAIHFLA